jgi:hypothetical protein
MPIQPAMPDGLYLRCVSILTDERKVNRSMATKKAPAKKAKKTAKKK